MRALITGGQGFVGSWLAAHLRAEGDEVVIIDKETDVADPEAIGPAVQRAAPDAIYHLAALTHVGESWDSPGQVLRVNVLGTAEVLAAARRHAPGAVVLAISSAEVYGVVRPEDLPINEQAPIAPATPYAASKAAGESIALQAWRGYGQAVIVVRPFNHIGPGQAPNFAVSALARRIVEARGSGQRTLRVGTLSTRRDFTDVRDVVRAYRQLVVSAPLGEVFNVCSGQDVAIQDIADRLLTLAGAELSMELDPSLVRPVDVPVLRGDGAALATRTGWHPEITLEDTLRDVLTYWEKELDVAATT